MVLTSMLSRISHAWLFLTLWTTAHQAPLSMGYSRQEYWNVLPCPPPGDLPDAGIEPSSHYVSCIGRQVLYPLSHLGILKIPRMTRKHQKWVAVQFLESPTPSLKTMALSSYSLAYEIVLRACSIMSDSLQLHRLYSPWDSSGQKTGVGSLSLFQGIFPTQRSNPGLLHCRRILHEWSHKLHLGSPLSLWNRPPL